MRINPSATTNALQQLNTLTSGTNNAGVQTRSWNPNVAPIKLDNVQGGITLKIRHPPMSEFSNVPITPSNPNSSTTLQTPPWRCPEIWNQCGRSSTMNRHANNQQSYRCGGAIRPNAEEWWKAMAKEAMGNKWVLVLKHNKNGTPIQHKARLVAQGFSQQPGIDFDKTFAPVVRLDSIRTLVSIANQYDWDIRQLNVNSAYLHAEVDKDLYMQQIPYFSNGTNKVLKLKRSIYGLKQAGRMWNKLYDTKLKAIGYTPCFTDACVYHRINNINDTIDTREFIPIFSNLNELERTTFPVTRILIVRVPPVTAPFVSGTSQQIHRLQKTRPTSRPHTAVDCARTIKQPISPVTGTIPPTLPIITSRTPSRASSAPPNAPPPTKAAHIPMRWQPVPGAPLVPRPLSIKESWDPLFRQPPMSREASNQRSMGKSPLAAQSPSSWIAKPSHPARTRTRGTQGGQQGSPRLDGSEDRKPLAVEATPRPISKTDPLPAPSAPLIAWANPTKPPITFAQPTPVRAPPRVPTPTPPAPIRLQSPLASQPAAPVVAYQAPVKVDHPDAYTGKIGNESRQWLTRMMAWVRLNQRMFPTNQEVLSFLLMNMKDTAGAWAHPHLDQLGSHRAIIQTVEDFRREFLTAFGNPDATRAAERQITNLTQTGTCAEYITKFRTIAMDLDWNDAALCGQFARGLHWEVSRLIATRERRPTTLLELQNAALVIDNALREERASHPPKGNKSGTSNTTPNRGASTGQQATRPGRLSSDPNFVSEEEQNRRRAEGLCIKCGRTGHKFAECRTGWKATPKEEGVKKEAAKIGKESGSKSGKD
ncbi:cysteine-rich RLK (RECEPTOR-like protein kinase) 8 [Rhizoctonia solani]|uniref:Cysteine-rich RLK (RECEPTOR-like protein kinase) 8 n=1 Tax=Rhizoctonia solani TaxID=456999 RepID=A0A8H7I0P8_9AGAM|nr:cysteine-rich RLK (RECEPTOR-like protein kinase) 8 [Rhizoctonia solani]